MSYQGQFFLFFLKVLFIYFKFVIPDDAINHFETTKVKTQKILKTLFLSGIYKERIELCHIF